ncbi:chaperonin 10-like protein [Schizophyllum fasciatum]
MSIDYTVFKGSSSGQVYKSTASRQLKADDVVVKITHSGLCYSDVHFKHRDMVLGHEGVGVVSSVGPACWMFKPGDRVGWGFVRDTCGHCEMCLEGEDMYCPDGDTYGNKSLDTGSLASHAVIRESFLFKIPDNLELSDAAPMMCAGATVFEALSRYGVRSTDRIGVIGVGGLGHLAIQFAAKMGCEVVVFSGTDNKREEAMAMGATEFYAVKDVSELAVERKIHCLLVTGSGQINWGLYMPIMAPKGKIFPLTVEIGNFVDLPALPMNIKGLTLQGVCVAPRQVYPKMLGLAAHHGIKPVIEQFPMTEAGIAQAMERVEQGKMRYRAVLVAED